MEQYKDDMLGYARITVDYNGGKKVYFSSPYESTEDTINRKLLHSFGFVGLFYLSPIFVIWSILCIVLDPYGELFTSNNIYQLELFIIMVLAPFLAIIIIAQYWENFSKYYNKMCTYLITPFKKRILVDNLKDKEFVIPFYSNTYLDYKAFGEYSDFLERIDIEDVKMKIKCGKEYKDKVVFWKAIFKFSQVPSKGKLEIGYF